MEESTKKVHDLTDFFLEWRDTCAIDRCKRTEDVAYVHSIFDNWLRLAVSQPRVFTVFEREKEGKDLKEKSRSDDSGVPLGSYDETAEKGRKVRSRRVAVSEYIDLVNGVMNSDDNVRRIHAFYLVESFFYGRDKINGVPFKNYLFEKVASDGGVGNLTGYFRNTLIRSVLKQSFRGSNVYTPLPGNEEDVSSNPIDVIPKKPEGRINPSTDTDPDLQVCVRECLDLFRKIVVQRWERGAIDFRLALLCDAFRIPKSDPEIVAASGLKQSAFYNRVPLRDVFEELMTLGCSPEDCFVAFRHAPDVIGELGSRDPKCRPVFVALEKREERE